MKVRLEFVVADASLAKHVIAGVTAYLQRFGIQLANISTERES